MAPGESWASVGASGLALRLRKQTHCGDPSAAGTTGLVAYVAGEPVGWCAVEPRPAYARMLRNNRVPWEGRSEDKLDGSVWAVTSFVVRRGFRRRGIGSALARTAVDFARRRGASAVEAYPTTTKEALSSELHVGTHGMFVEAGFTEVGRPSIRRAVMRIDF
jgi:GNAT superfamily N-acetyltransferase